MKRALLAVAIVGVAGCAVWALMFRDMSDREPQMELNFKGYTHDTSGFGVARFELRNIGDVAWRHRMTRSRRHDVLNRYLFGPHLPVVLHRQAAHGRSTPATSTRR
jgi:hypothetical protein